MEVTLLPILPFMLVPGTMVQCCQVLQPHPALWWSGQWHLVVSTPE